LLADVFPLYLKTKNSHWHMSGPNFRDYRLLLDEHADQIFAMTDDIAERAAKSAGRRCAPSATSPVSGGSRTMTKAPSHQKRC
jgi:DNA-binding ferritin-like protein